MEEKLKFYAVDKDFISYLKKFDKKVPDIEYENNDKFVCGVVFEIKGFKYYAPVSHFNTQQRTNFIIRDVNGKNVSSIRFCFMIPVSDEYLTEKNINEYNEVHRRFVHMEYKYCNDHWEEIIKTAQKVYKIGSNPRHPLNKDCCNFLLLEEKTKEYKK